VQVDPAAQAVGPVQLSPPHWPHLGDVAVGVELGADVVVLGDDLVDVDKVEEGLLEAVVVLVDDGALDDETTTPPGPATLVVKPPDSTYTPLKK